MAYKTPVDRYVRTNRPSSPESQVQYLAEELRKLERVLETYREALIEAEKRLTAGNL